MKGNLAALSILSLSVFCGIAHGQQASNSVDDIVNFFTSPENQITRGICVGSDEECATANKPPPAFDLMINFGKNSAELTDEARNNLLQFSVAMRHPKLATNRFAVEGFTDASGSDEHNLKLSERRAQSVTDFLTELGIEPERLKSAGYGETRMRVPDALDPVNRRVETRILRE